MYIDTAKHVGQYDSAYYRLLKQIKTIFMHGIISLEHSRWNETPPCCDKLFIELNNKIKF